MGQLPYMLIHIRKAMVLLTIIFFTAVLLSLWIAPLAVPAGTMDDLSGKVGSIENSDLFVQLPFPWKCVYLIGDIWCHQISTRSFYINNNQMPFCARCTGILSGIAPAVAVFYYLGNRSTLPDRKSMIAIFFISFGILAIDGFGQTFGLWTSGNLERFMTGFFAGLAAGMVIYLFIVTFKNDDEKILI